MDELKRLEEATDKVSDFQKRYNIGQKKISYIIGKNLTLFVCLLVPLLLVGFVWTDFGAIIFSTKMIADGIVTVALLAIGETAMMLLGSDGGRMDEEYLDAKSEFEKLLKQVHGIGTLLMDAFCDWQIDVEMEQAIRSRLRMLRLTPKQWESIKELGEEELTARYGKKRARKMLEIINLEPIELNASILLFNGEYTARGGVPESGEEYLHKTRRRVSMMLAWALGGLLTISVMISLTKDISFARVIYTVFKLVVLLFRMARGYDRGARAYNTVEVRRIDAKSNYLRQYLKFIEDKLYLKLGDKYGDISQFVAEEKAAFETEATEIV